MDFEHATPDVIARAIAEEIDRDIDYLPVEVDGDHRAALRIAELLNSPRTTTTEGDHMKAITLQDLPIVIEDGAVQIRLRDEDGLSVGFVRLPAGADLRGATKGLPDDLCPCPHWGFMIKGRVRMHTPDGHMDFEAGQAFYWAAGHAPEALEDSEYVDFSPTTEFQRVIEHITSGAAAAD